MSFRTEFEKVADSHYQANPPGLSNDRTSKALEDYYKVVHSPILAGAIRGVKYGLPAAAIGAVASPNGLRSRNALILGGAIGALTGLAAATQQIYSNATEKAHLVYHLDSK